jgi:hypothetical protein
MRGWLVIGVTLLGCGGRYDQRMPIRDEPSLGGVGGGGSAGAPTSAGTGSGGETLEEPDVTPLGCPNPSWETACDSRISVSLNFEHPVMDARGRTVEPIQTPTYDFSRPWVRREPVDEANWDRSRVPAGACVFRMRGYQAGCFDRNMQISIGNCGDQPKIVPLGFYEMNRCEEGIAPGCPNSDQFGEGSWWYLVPSEDDSNDTNLVICAPECAMFPRGPDSSVCLTAPAD